MVYGHIIMVMVGVWCVVAGVAVAGGWERRRSTQCHAYAMHEPSRQFCLKHLYGIIDVDDRQTHCGIVRKYSMDRIGK